MYQRADTRDDALVALFERRGAARVETPILQPASLFLDLSGEEIRRRLLVTQDAEGGEFCLRPEHTIPVCREHFASGRDSGEYFYLGPVFRQRPGESGEFVQAGCESIGREDATLADAEMLVLALDGVAVYGRGAVVATVGDMDLIEAVLAALEVPRPLHRRLVRRLAAGGAVDDVLAAEARPAGSDYAGLLAAIEGQDAGAARAFVEDVISIAGIATVGGRSAAEIAERFLSRAANRSTDISERARDLLRRYLAIEGEAEFSIAALRALARDGGLEIGSALDRFEERLALIRAGGADMPRIRFAAGLARNFDYYTGFVFELRGLGDPRGRFLAAGGRYDRLLQHLGSAGPIPAVGVSFWLDRLSAETTP